jgi:hypothetical protein
MTARFRVTLRGMLVATLVAVATAWASDADAAFKITIDNPATVGVDATLTDGDFDGVISFGPAAGSFTLNFGVGVSKPALGGVSGPRMDLSSFNASTAAATLVIKMTDTGFMAGPGSAFMSIGGTTDGSVSYKAYWDPSNAEFGTANQIGSTLTFGPGGINFPFSGSALMGGVGSTSPFSLTQVITITHAAGGRFPKATSFDASLTVPAPAAIAQFGLGLLGLSVVARRRRRSDRA